MIATFFLVIPHVLQFHGDHGEAFHELLHPGRPWASCPMENTWKTYGKHIEMYIYVCMENNHNPNIYDLCSYDML